MYTCDICQLEVHKTSELYNVNDESLCEECFNEAVSRAEYYDESLREEQFI